MKTGHDGHRRIWLQPCSTWEAFLQWCRAAAMYIYSYMSHLKAMHLSLTFSAHIC